MDKQSKVLLISGGVLVTGAITILLVRKRNKQKQLPPAPNTPLPIGFRNWKGGHTYLKGAPRGVRNNNPGNLVRTSIPWKGKVKGQDVDRKFEVFMNPAYGVRAMVMTLRSKIQNGKNTIETLIGAYAPPTENNTSSYIATVSKDLKVSSTAKLLPTKNTLRQLAMSMGRVEAGGNYVTNVLFEQAYSMI